MTARGAAASAAAPLTAPLTTSAAAFAAALVLTVIAAGTPLGSAQAGVLTAQLSDGTEIARLEVPEGSGWCVVWRHSVEGFEVQDCYENRNGKMVLVKSLQPDFAAGLGHIPGRGLQRSDGRGGYLIEELNEAVPGNAYVLRPGGPAVDHRLRTARAEVSLSDAAARHAADTQTGADQTGATPTTTRARVTIALTPDTPTPGRPSLQSPVPRQSGPE